MSNEITTVIMGPNRGSTYTGSGQFQLGNDSQSQAIAANGMDKGGLRGVAMLFVMLAEFKARKKSIELAEDYYKLNKRDFDFFKATHQPGMAASATEAMSITTNPNYVPDYQASAAAGVAKAGIADRQWFETRRRAHRYARGRQRKVDFDFAMLRLHAVIAGWNVARRYEYTYAQTHNNRAFDRKLGVANVGIGVGNIVRQGLAASVGKLASAYDVIGDTVSSIGNGLAAYSGYRASRESTRERFKNGVEDNGN